jgi:hypothetical protein
MSHRDLWIELSRRDGAIHLIGIRNVPGLSSNLSDRFAQNFREVEPHVVRHLRPEVHGVFFGGHGDDLLRKASHFDVSIG